MTMRRPGRGERAAEWGYGDNEWAMTPPLKRLKERGVVTKK